METFGAEARALCILFGAMISHMPDSDSLFKRIYLGFFLINLFLERESMHVCVSRGGAEREFQAGSTLSTQSLMRGSNSRTGTP